MPVAAPKGKLPPAQAARRAVEHAHDVLGGLLRRDLEGALEWISIAETEYAMLAQESLRYSRENPELRAQVAELAAANEALSMSRLELCKQVEVAQRMARGVMLPSALELERLVEDRRRLLERLGVDEYTWMATGGVYFPKPPGRK